MPRRLHRLVGVGTLDERNLLLRQQVTEPPRDRFERVFLFRLPLGSAEMREQNDAGAAVQ